MCQENSCPPKSGLSPGTLVGGRMDIPEKQAKIMKILRGASPRLGMKARWIANELYGPPSNPRRRLRDGHEICGTIAELSENGLIEDVRNSASGNPGSWVLTEKGKNLLEEMKD